SSLAGRTSRSNARNRVLEKGKKRKGNTTMSTIVVIWKSCHGGAGQVHIRKATTQTLKTVSTAIRLKKYAPSQWPSSPRSNPRPHTGQLGSKRDQVTKIGPPPQWGHRNRRARTKGDI